MKAVQIQSDRETYRVLLLRPDRKELLLVPHEAGFQLPCLEIPRWERVAENLTAAMKSKWGCNAVCLFALRAALETDDGDALRYQAMESCHDCESDTDSARWVSVSALSPESFHDAADYEALRQFFAECNGHEKDPCFPFAKPGWFHQVEEWISEAIQRVDLQLTGRFRQFNGDPSFSLIRFETNGTAVWFKAVGDPNRHEFPITLKLAELFPTFLPKIIGTRPDWNGWLSLELAGTRLSDTRLIGSWERAAATLALLQVESLGKTHQIILSGARTLSPGTLATSVHPFFSSMRELMQRQRKIPPPVLSGQELWRLEAEIQRWHDRLLELGLPDTLGNLDSNPGNIMVSSESCTFLDWAEAYVGNPFFTFHYLLEHFRRTCPDSARESKFIGAYAQEWERVLPAGVIDEALQLSVPIAVFAYASRTAAREDAEVREDPGFPGYLRSLTRRMHRETNDLNSRRLSCLC